MDKNSPLSHEKLTSAPEEPGLPSYNSTLYNICQEENIQLQLLSNNWVKRLEKGKQVHYILGYKFDLNSYSAGAIADDKYATYSVLQYKQLPAVPHHILYDFTNTAAYTRGRNSYEFAEDFFQEHGQHIVIKPTAGTGGRQVHQVTAKEEILPVLIKLFSKHPSVCLCPYYHIAHEYRMVLLDNEVRLAYMKTLPAHQPNSWKFNLQQGATAEPISSTKYTEIAILAKRAAHAIGMRFGSVDIIETFDGELLILEINSGVMTTKYLQQHPEEYPRIYQLYHDAIRKMFL